MRARVTAIAIGALCFAASAAAIPYVPPPQPVYEAPIDRALENVAAMEGLEEAQRERLLGRLNLLAYARDDADFAYMQSDNSLVEAGSVRCADAPRNMRGAQEEGPPVQPDDRCAAFDFQLGPQAELPDAPPERTRLGGLARLRAAEQHYRRALRLDRDDLRARLGFAYVLDRMGRRSEARRELLRIIDRGLPRLIGDTSEWEDHAVLSEAAEHLDHLVRTSNDRIRVQRLRTRLEASRPVVYVTPMVVPLTEGPFARLIDMESEVAFDFAGTGDRRTQGWLDGEAAAWLVWDPEWRGEIHSGFDMIGQRTWAVFWSDGFEALRALDDNRDGELTGAELGGLSLWRDSDGDGVSDDGEVIPVLAHGVAALATRGEATRPGLITAPNGVRFDDGRTRPLYDWTPGLEQRAPVS
ncbi:MAG: tetratricopeptide repeat protein [Hyphomonadaceae bacterium]